MRKYSRDWQMLFAVYMVVLLRLTVFRPGFLHPNWMGGTIYFQPLNYYRWLSAAGRWREFWVNLLGNTVSFAPFGVWLCYRRFSWRKCALCGLALTLTIETAQFVLGTGNSDFDDVVLNVIGVMAGWGFWQMVRKMLKKVE